MISIKIVDKNSSMDFLEKSMLESIGDDFRHRYLPYIQLHEFEGLLFNDIKIFYEQIPTNELVGKDELKKLLTILQTGNDKRYERSFYLTQANANSKGYNKIVYGDILADAIGLENIRKRSHRFNQWLRKIEDL